MFMKKLILGLVLITFSISLSIAQENTTDILNKAAEIAKNENKVIFVKFEASWCGWCKRMKTNMQAETTKALFDTNYVMVDLVVMESPNNKKLENPGGQELLEKHGGANSGIPYWLILDSDLNLLTNSRDANNDNIGCPATPDEVKAFVEKLQETSNLSQSDLAIITEQFVDKK